MDKRFARAGILLFLGALAVGLAFQGSRGIWEPDEGFYSNVSIGMLTSGDWLVPRLNGREFLDKPPLTYWGSAAGFRALGRNELGARAAHAFYFAGSVLLVGLLGARWWGRGAGVAAAIVFATSLGPFLAFGVLTPDGPLCFFVIAVYYCFAVLDSPTASGPRRLAALGFGLALGLGGLAKGPAVLVFVAPFVAFQLARETRTRVPRSAILWAAGIFLAVAVPWYAYIVWKVPGAGAYMLDNQVNGRLFTAKYGRNVGTFGALAVYVPTLLLGSLPWNLAWVRWRRASPGRARRRSAWALLRSDDAALLAVSWLVISLAVLFAARSRLPLYALPLFAPFSLLTGRKVAASCFSGQRASRRCAVIAALWLGVLITGKALVPLLSAPRDSARLAAALRSHNADPSRALVLVDMKRNGLALYGWSRLQEATISADPYPFFSPPVRLERLAAESAWSFEAPLLLVRLANAPAVRVALEEAGCRFSEGPMLEDLVLIDASDCRRLCASCSPER